MLSLLITLLSHVVLLTLRTQPSGGFPAPLDKETEHALFLRARNGDREARTTLIEHNLRLVAHIVRKYYSTCRDQEDLVSIGTIGLIKAIDSFDVENGAGFATYAGKCLQNEILMYFRSQKKLALENSINDPVDIDRDGNPLTYNDILSVDDDIVEVIDQKIRTSRLYRALDIVLTTRERTVILLRYGLTGGRCCPQREVAERLKISRSYVSRIEKTALEKLNAYFEQH